MGVWQVRVSGDVSIVFCLLDQKMRVDVDAFFFFSFF